MVFRVNPIDKPKAKAVSSEWIFARASRPNRDLFARANKRFV